MNDTEKEISRIRLRILRRRQYVRIQQMRDEDTPEAYELPPGSVVYDRTEHLSVVLRITDGLKSNVFEVVLPLETGGISEEHIDAVMRSFSRALKLKLKEGK